MCIDIWYLFIYTYIYIYIYSRGDGDGDGGVRVFFFRLLGMKSSTVLIYQRFVGRLSPSPSDTLVSDWVGATEAQERNNQWWCRATAGDEW